MHKKQTTIEKFEIELWQGRVNTFHPGRGNILALMSVPLIRFPGISVIYGSLHRHQRPGRNILTGHVNFSRKNTKLNQNIGTRIQRILFVFSSNANLHFGVTVFDRKYSICLLATVSRIILS